MRHLSIFASDSQPSIKRMGLTLLIAILILLVSDSFAGTIIPRLTDQAPIILSGYSSEGVAALLNLSQTVKPIVAFTGSSEMQTAASPIVFNNQIKAISNDSVYSVNVSVLGAVTTVNHDILRNLLIPHGIKTVFYAAIRP
jgi:hypothetical protein